MGLFIVINSEFCYNNIVVFDNQQTSKEHIMNHVILHENKTYNVELWTIQDILDCVNSPDNKIQIQPPEFQRDFVANVEWSQNLVQSFLEGRSSNLIHFRKLDDEKAEKVGFRYQCLDGLQRITSIIEFIDNKFTDLNGKYFS